MDIIKTELEEIKAKYGDERRSTIEYSANEMRIEDLIPNEAVFSYHFSCRIYQRTSLREYKVQIEEESGQRILNKRKDF